MWHLTLSNLNFDAVWPFEKQPGYTRQKRLCKKKKTLYKWEICLIMGHFKKNCRKLWMPHWLDRGVSEEVFILYFYNCNSRCDWIVVVSVPRFSCRQFPYSQQYRLWKPQSRLCVINMTMGFWRPDSHLKSQTWRLLIIASCYSCTHMYTLELLDCFGNVIQK